jgi:hypothetical protein
MQVERKMSPFFMLNRMRAREWGDDADGVSKRGRG